MAGGAKALAATGLGKALGLGRLASVQSSTLAKMAYLFGKATGAKNVARSTSMYKDLVSIGINDTPEMRQYVAGMFVKALRNARSVVGKDPGSGNTIREFLLMGPRGGVKVVSRWAGRRLITFWTVKGR